MNHTLAHPAGFHQRFPLLKHCPDFTRERCEGFQRATLLTAAADAGGVYSFDSCGRWRVRSTMRRLAGTTRC